MYDYQKHFDDEAKDGSSAEPRNDVKQEGKDKSMIVHTLNDRGNAELFAELHRGQAYYVPEKGTWFTWNRDKARWIQGEAGFDERWAALIDHRFAESDPRVDRATRFGETITAKQSLKWANKAGNKGSRDSLWKLARNLPGMSIPQDQLDADPNLLGVANGVLDLRTGELRSGLPEDKVTRYATAAYNPEAECREFERFIDEIACGRKDLVAFLQELLGYCLSGYTKEQAFLVFIGKGANGKSTLVELLTKLLGAYSVGMPGHAFVLSESRAIRNDLARIVGARVASSVEINTGRKLDEALVKRITGCDTVTARLLGKEFFDFHPYAKFLFSLNTYPEVTGADNGIYRRLVFVPFDADFTEVIDPDLPAKLAKELDGVLTWAMEGFQRWFQRGRLVKPACVLQAGKQFRSTMDTIGDFIEDCCDVGPEYSEKLKTLFDAYKKWCLEVCIDPVGKQTFSILLQQKGFVKGKSGSWKWFGLSLKGSTSGSGALLDDTRDAAKVLWPAENTSIAHDTNEIETDEELATS